VATIPLSDEIIGRLNQAAELYHRLILVVAPSRAGKTTALLDVATQGGCRYINVSLELSRRLLDLTVRQRALQVPRLLADILNKEGTRVALLDNLEILFAVSLRQDPLRLLQGLSRNQTVVAAWNGVVEGRYLLYAKPDHPEYRCYPIDDLVIISLLGS
jgi:hypothetical protein